MRNRIISALFGFLLLIVFLSLLHAESGIDPILQRRILNLIDELTIYPSEVLESGALLVLSNKGLKRVEEASKQLVEIGTPAIPFLVDKLSGFRDSFNIDKYYTALNAADTLYAMGPSIIPDLKKYLKESENQVLRSDIRFIIKNLESRQKE